MGALNSAGTKYSKRLRQTDVKRMSYATCKQRYGSFINGMTMLCAGDFDSKRSDSCYGDSGGPLYTLTKPPKLVGVVSFGADCADPYYPGVYADVAGGYKWIKNTVCKLSKFKPKFCGGKKKKNGNKGKGKNKR